MRSKILVTAIVGTGLALYTRLNGPSETTPLAASRAASPRPATGSLRLLSLNLGHGRGRASSHLSVDAAGHREALERVAALIVREDPDVIALQEVDGASWWSGGFDHLSSLFERLDRPATAHGLHARAFGLQYGTALVSRDALDEPVSHAFGASGFTPRKGFVVARTTLDGRTLDVVSLHLDFALPNVRQRQLTELARVMQQRNQPVVLLGDFNMEPAILASFAREHDLSTRPVDVTFPSTGGRLDHVLVSEKLVLDGLDVLPDHVSDHRAVRASVRWR